MLEEVTADIISWVTIRFSRCARLSCSQWNLWHPCPCCFLVLKALSWKLASKMIKVKVKSSVLHLCSMNTMRKSSWKKLELCIPFKNGMILQLLLLWGKSNCFKEGISKLRYKSFSSTWLQIPITMSGYGSLYHPNKRFFKYCL